MDKEQKKAVMLLKSLILHYHGLDDDEREILERAAAAFDSKEELTWANNFISDDYLSAFERSKDFFAKNIVRFSKDERLKHLRDAWEENHEKGYVTEMETTAMINLSKDWGVEKEFFEVIQH
ncbi:MAG: hypothetical protein RJQ14_17930 [Marinoscillum sp.]